MKPYSHIAKFILFFFLTLPFITGSVQESYILPVTQNQEQGTDNEEQEETSYIKAFNAVSQNVQHLIVAPFIPVIKSEYFQKKLALIVNDTFDHTATHYFRILFQLIISTNAP